MRLIDSSKLRRKIPAIATEAHKLVSKSDAKAIIDMFINAIQETPTVYPKQNMT